MYVLNTEVIASKCPCLDDACRPRRVPHDDNGRCAIVRDCQRPWCEWGRKVKAAQAAPTPFWRKPPRSDYAGVKVRWRRGELTGYQAELQIRPASGPDKCIYGVRRPPTPAGERAAARDRDDLVRQYIPPDQWRRYKWNFGEQP